MDSVVPFLVLLVLLIWQAVLRISYPGHRHRSHRLWMRFYQVVRSARPAYVGEIPCGQGERLGRISASSLGSTSLDGRCGPIVSVCGFNLASSYAFGRWHILERLPTFVTRFSLDEWWVLRVQSAGCRSKSLLDDSGVVARSRRRCGFVESVYMQTVDIAIYIRQLQPLKRALRSLIPR